MTPRDSLVSAVTAVSLILVLVAVLGLETFLKGVGAIFVALLVLAGVALLAARRG